MIIVLNKMFSGSYLNENLGHEVINLFKSDNGNHYLYLNHNGRFDKKYKPAVGRQSSFEAMLLVKNGPLPKTLEVIGIATGLQDIFPLTGVYNPKDKKEAQAELLAQIEYILQENIKYGGTYLHNIFAGNDYQYVNLTFKAKDVKLVRKGAPIIISFDPNYTSHPGGTVVQITQKGEMRNSLREYFDESEEAVDYKELSNLVNTTTLWGDSIDVIDMEQLMKDYFFGRIVENNYLNKLFK